LAVDEIIQTEGLSKRFGSLIAVQDLDLGQDRAGDLIGFARGMHMDGQALRDLLNPLDQLLAEWFGD